MTLVWLAAAFILGIFLGFVAALPPVFLLLVLAGLALLVALGVWRRGRLRLAFLLGCCLFLGGARSGLAGIHIGPTDVGYYNGQTVTLVGYVNAEPDERDTGNNYVIAVQQRVLGTRSIPLHGLVELHTAAGQVFDEGDQVQLTGVLSTPVNSASVPYRSILANRGIYSEMSFPKGFVVGHVSLGLVGFADQIRSGIENTIKSALPEPEATFLIALLIGARSAQLGALAPVLIDTGLIHLIAISGIKVAIVAGTVNEFLRLVASRTPRLILSSVILLSYWLVSGATVAGLRASIMWLLIFVAAWLGRPTFGLVSLAIAASVMLWIEPRLLWDNGFQLTTVATAAMTLFTPGLNRVFRWVPNALRASLTTTMAAQAGVLPIQIASFHVASPISILANAIVLPFIPLTMVVGFATAIFRGWIFAPIAFGLVHMIILVASWASTLAPIFSVTAWPSLVDVAYYCGLAVLAYLAWHFATFDRTAARGEWLFAFCMAAVGLGFVVSPNHRGDRISFITTGSALITWHGSAVLVDGGVKPSQLLTALGANLPYPNESLDAIVDTSPTAKNVASLTGAAQDVPIREVFDPGLEYPSQTYARWRQTLLARNIPTFALRRGLTIRLPAGLSIRCVAPDGIYSNPKDGAGILLIETPRERFLYLGDASPTEQQDLAFTGQSLRATTLISSVPVDPTFAHATRYRDLVAPTQGTFLNLSG